MEKARSGFPRHATDVMPSMPVTACYKRDGKTRACCNRLKRSVSLASKLHKPFLQSRERDDLIVAFVIHCSIDNYDSLTKNHSSERDPPRPRSEHKFYGISLLINLYTAICIYRGLSRDVPVFAQIGTDGSRTNEATSSSKQNAIRRDRG